VCAMAEVMGYEDIVRDIKNTIVLYKGDPVYVTGVSEDCVVSFKNMKTQKNDKQAFNLDDFTNPNKRLGMANSCGMSFYVSRIPFRKMTIGHALGNISFEYYNHHEMIEDQKLRDGLAHLQKMHTKELAATMLGEYPPFDKALEFITKKGEPCSMAFDRQFAITHKREIIYKTRKVGVLPKGKKTIKGIVWDAGREHLSILIGGNCAETLRNLREA
jgi:hypothetical protein